MLSITDGLFRETVRAVPTLPGADEKYDSVTIAEQLVDSAVYRFVFAIGSLLWLICYSFRLFREPQ